MKTYSLKALLLSTLTLASGVLKADDSARAFYQLAERPVTLIDMGFYRLNLDLDKQLIPNVADLLNTREEQIGMRSYLSSSPDTDIILIVEARLKGAFDDSRSTRKAKALCDKITAESALYFFRNPLIDYFQTFDPFEEPLPDELESHLESALRLSAIVPTKEGLPEYRCMRPLKLR